MISSQDAFQEQTGQVIPPGRQLCSTRWSVSQGKLFLSHSFSHFFSKLSLVLTERCMRLQAKPSALFHSCQTDLAACGVEESSKIDVWRAFWDTPAFGNQHIQNSRIGFAFMVGKTALFPLSSCWVAKYKPCMRICLFIKSKTGQFVPSSEHVHVQLPYDEQVKSRVETYLMGRYWSLDTSSKHLPVIL